MNARAKGFTMVELILTLAFLSVVGVIMVPYYQAGVIQSPTLVQRTEATANLQLTMENVIARAQQLAQETTDSLAGEMTAANLNTLKTEVDGNISQFAPAGFTVTVEESNLVSLYPYASPTLSPDYEQDDSGNPRQFLLLTLHSDEGGTLTYIFADGSNYPTFN